MMKQTLCIVIKSILNINHVMINPVNYQGTASQNQFQGKINQHMSRAINQFNPMQIVSRNYKIDESVHQQTPTFVYPYTSAPSLRIGTPVSGGQNGTTLIRPPTIPLHKPLAIPVNNIARNQTVLVGKTDSLLQAKESEMPQVSLIGLAKRKMKLEVNVNPKKTELKLETGTEKTENLEKTKQNEKSKVPGWPQEKWNSMPDESWLNMTDVDDCMNTPDFVEK